jgi:hypothetical protein
MMEAELSFETSVLTRPTQLNIPEDGIPHLFLQTSQVMSSTQALQANILRAYLISLTHHSRSIQGILLNLRILIFDSSNHFPLKRLT